MEVIPFFASINESIQSMGLIWHAGLNIYNSGMFLGQFVSTQGSIHFSDLDLPVLSALGDAKPLKQKWGTTINIEEYWKHSVAELRLRFLEKNTDYLIEFDFLIPQGCSNTIQFFIGYSVVGTMTIPKSYDGDWKQWSRYILLSTGDNTHFNIFFVPDYRCVVLLKNVSWGVIE